MTPTEEARATSAQQYWHARPQENKHERLFWGGRNGPEYMLFMLRVIMLVCAVSVAILPG